MRRGIFGLMEIGESVGGCVGRLGPGLRWT